MKIEQHFYFVLPQKIIIMWTGIESWMGKNEQQTVCYYKGLNP